MKPTSLKELFDHPSRWIKGALRGRRDGMGFVKRGFHSHAHDKTHNCFCLVGGILHVYGYGRCPRAPIVAAIEKFFPGRVTDETLVDFNNHPDTTFADLRKVIEEANV